MTVPSNSFEQTTVFPQNEDLPWKVVDRKAPISFETTMPPLSELDGPTRAELKKSPVPLSDTELKKSPVSFSDTELKRIP